MNRITIQKRIGAAPRHTPLMRFGIPLLFFGCYFVFLLHHIDPAVIFSSNGMNIHNYVATMHAQEASPQHAASYADPPFRRLFILELTPAYLQEIAVTPGGWTRLAVTLCIYACHYPIAGALIITGLALFFFWIFPLYLLGICAVRPFILRFVPPFFLMTICAWYELSDCAFLLPVAGALACAVFYQRLPASAVSRTLWLSLLFWLAWYLMQWGCLLVLLFIVIHELFSGERRIAAVVMATAANGALLYAVDALFIPLDMTIHWKNFTELSGLPLVAIAFFPLAAIFLAAWGRLRRVPEGTTETIGAIVRTSLLVCGIAAAAVWLCRGPVNRDTRTIARTMRHVMNGQWEEVLHEKTAALFADFPQRAGPLQEFMVHAVNHALCRTGRLGDRLFTFPQKVFSCDPLLMLESMRTNGYVHWAVVLDLAMDLGMVNTAEKIAGEIMENVGPYPDIIHRRALVQIAKGNTEAAAVYLSKLACMPFYRAEARRLLGMLDNNGALISEPRVSAMRANMDTADYFLFTVSYETTFKNLLKSNPGNKAAYDYLMTLYLLTGRPDGVAECAPAAPSLGYTMLPRCWEEALCVFWAMSSRQASFGASNSLLRQETIGRFNEFTRVYSNVADDPAAAARLAPAYGDSYFYFSIFRHSRGARHE
ncbi:MAG: hypothetical protein JW699_03120 [Chitinispirillaceae bacterium]|nr:hypothetical protein [Chitinispirillaceae bacterium]